MKLVFFDFVHCYGGSQQCTVLLCDKIKHTDEAYVIDAYGFCKDYMEALAARNIRTYVLSPEAKYGVIGHSNRRLRRMWAFLRQLPAFFKLRRRLIRQIMQIEPDVVWTNSFKALFFLTVSWKLRRYPVCMYAHGWYQKSQVSWFMRFLVKRRADCVLVVSNPTKEALKSWGVPESKIHVVFNAVDFDSILKEAKKKPLAPLPRLAKNYKILVPAHLLHTKGQHTAIKAAAILRQKGLEFVMLLAGEEVAYDKSGYKDYLGQLIRNNGLEENVFMLGWRSDIPQVMGLSDALVLPTHTEGLPRVVLEAMMLGKPVIATPVGGITDLIVDGETGLLANVEDENAFAKCLEKLMSDKCLSDRIATGARKYISEKFCLEHHVSLVREVFKFEIAKKQENKHFE